MLPDLQPTLYGTLLTLRPLQAGDYDALLLAAADPLIWEQHPERSRYKPEVFMSFLEGGLASGGAFTAIDNATGGVIGSSRYYDYDPALQQVAIGYTFLIRRCWANGYNKEMKTLMINHAFTFASTILFHIGEHNYRSQQATIKTGAALFSTVEGKQEYRLAKEQWAQNTGYKTI